MPVEGGRISGGRAIRRTSASVKARSEQRDTSIRCCCASRLANRRDGASSVGQACSSHSSLFPPRLHLESGHALSLSPSGGARSSGPVALIRTRRCAGGGTPKAASSAARSDASVASGPPPWGTHTSRGNPSSSPSSSSSSSSSVSEPPSCSSSDEPRDDASDDAAEPFDEPEPADERRDETDDAEEGGGGAWSRIEGSPMRSSDQRSGLPEAHRRAGQGPSPQARWCGAVASQGPSHRAMPPHRTPPPPPRCQLSR